MNEYSILANNLKKYRNENKLTQKQLGELIHKKEITIRKYESGDTKVPFNVVIDICRIFNIRPFDLFEDSNDFEGSNDLMNLYKEMNEDDMDLIFYTPLAYELIQNVKNNKFDYDALFSSLIIYYSNKYELEISLDDFSPKDELILKCLVESTVKTYLKAIKITQKKEDNKISITSITNK